MNTDRAHTRGGATVGRVHARGSATVGRVCARGGATVGRVRARGAVGQNRGGVRRNGRGGRIGNPLSQWEKIEKEESFKDSQYHEIEGCNYRMKEDSTCLDFLELYLTDEIMTLIVNETNRYAEQFLAVNIISAQNSYLSLWEATTVPEMKTFIGVILLMGIIYKTQIFLYWSTDPFYNTPIISEIMNRNRFYLLLLKFFHFNDNEDTNYNANDENRDRLHKVGPLIDLLRSRFRSVYTPGKHLSVDESLILYKGCLHFKQYIRTKRARFGMKLYELTTSDGITLDFLVYCGKGMFADDDINSEMPSSERIPSVLMETFLGKDHM